MKFNGQLLLIAPTSKDDKPNELYQHGENRDEYATTDLCFDRNAMYDDEPDEMLSMISSRPHFQLDQSFEVSIHIIIWFHIMKSFIFVFM